MKSKIILITIIALVALLAWLLYDQYAPAKPSQEGKLPASKLSVNDEGLIEVVLPENLLGGKTAEDFYIEALSNSEYQKLLTKVEINDDGRITEFYTPEQLEQQRQNNYTYAQYHKSFNVKSIKEVIFENEMLTEITVFVDKPVYGGELFERTMCNALLAVHAGKYQILTGVPPDEWHTTITIIDINTEEVLSIVDFPQEGMYNIL